MSQIRGAHGFFGGAESAGIFMPGMCSIPGIAWPAGTAGFAFFRTVELPERVAFLPVPFAAVRAGVPRLALGAP